MSTKVIMPQMGESIFEGTVTKWLKKIGEWVRRDEALFEISTDKVDSEIPSPVSGVLSEILVSEGQTVQINTVVGIIEEEKGKAEPAAPSKQAGKPPEVEIEEKKAPVEMPRVSSVESGPETAPAPTSAAPRVAPPPPGKPEEAPRLGRAPAQAREVRTSPLVRRLAREFNIDLAQVRGTGLDGRITKEDLLLFLQERGDAAAAAKLASEAAIGAASKAAIEAPAPMAGRASVAPAAEAVTPPKPPPLAGETETVSMTPMRKAIAEHMVLSKRTSPHVATVFEVDLTPVVGLRERVKDEFERREGIKLTFTPFFVKALIEAIREFPIVNSSVSGDNIVYKKRIHLGVAVALPEGLVVPVVKDAHLKSFTGLAHAVNDLAERARTKKLKPEDVQNGTVTITNPGVYGSLFGTPIINQPQVAIVGVGGIEKRPVVVDDAIAIRSMVYLALSFDHRVIDGAVADQFMAKVKDILQAWSQWRE